MLVFHLEKDHVITPGNTYHISPEKSSRDLQFYLFFSLGSFVLERSVDFVSRFSLYLLSCLL